MLRAIGTNVIVRREGPGPNNDYGPRWGKVVSIGTGPYVSGPHLYTIDIRVGDLVHYQYEDTIRAEADNYDHDVVDIDNIFAVEE